MPDAAARISVELQNADQVLAELRQLRAFVEGTGQAPSQQGQLPTTVASGGTPAGQNLAPPPAGTTPAQASAATQQAGTPAVAAQTATAPQSQAQGLLANAAAILGGMQAYNQLVSLGTQAAGAYGQSIAGATPLRPIQLLGPGIQLGGISAGAAIGFALGGPPGALIGGGIGSLVGGVGDAFVKPIVDREIANQLMGEVAHMASTMGAPPFVRNRLGNTVLSPEVANRAIQDISAGRQLDWSFYDVDYMLPQPMRGRYLEQMGRARYSGSALRRFGVPQSGEYSADLEMSLMGIAALDDPFQSAAFMESRGFTSEAEAFRESGVQAARNESAIRRASAHSQTEAMRFSRATRYGGSSAAQAQYGAFSASMSGHSAGLRAEAQRRLALDPADDRAYELMQQAEQIDLATDMAQEGVFSAMTQEAQAASSLATGRASRSFDKALYSGMPAASLPWGERSKALQGSANSLQAVMDARAAAGKLSPAERMMMTEQIEQLRYHATEGVAREREQLVNRETVAGSQLQSAAQLSRELPGMMRGSAVEQAEQYRVQAEVLERQQKTLEQILTTSRYLTNEQRLQLQTQVEQLKLETERTKLAGVLARSEAREMTFGTGQAELRGGIVVGQLRGGTASELTGFGIEGMRASQADVGFFNAEADRLVAEEGLSRDHPRVQALRRAAASSKVSAAQHQLALGNVEMSPALLEKRSLLQTEHAVMQMGYGSFGDVRANLLEQIAASRQRIDEIDSRMAELQRQGIEITPRMRSQFSQQRNEATLEAFQLMNMYDEGWDQRLISQAYNMPASGRLAMSQFTRREAAMSGVYHRAFGGSLEQTARMRTMYPRMRQMMGSGSPAAFLDRAIAGGEDRPLTINLNLRLEDSKGTLKETGFQITKTKTATDVNLNSSGQRRAPG